MGFWIQKSFNFRKIHKFKMNLLIKVNKTNQFAAIITYLKLTQRVKSKHSYSNIKSKTNKEATHRLRRIGYCRQREIQEQLD